jgi:type II secretion system protein H
MRYRCPKAFTLIELVMVMLVMSLALALIAPSLRGWNRSARLRDTAEQFVAAAGWARSQAASEGMIYRLQLDPSAGQYSVQVQQDDEFTAANGEFGRTTTLPEGYRFSVAGGANAIDFYPNGRITPIRVRIEAEQGNGIEIGSDNPAQPLRVVIQ